MRLQDVVGRGLLLSGKTVSMETDTSCLASLFSMFCVNSLDILELLLEAPEGFLVDIEIVMAIDCLLS